LTTPSIKPIIEYILGCPLPDAVTVPSDRRPFLVSEAHDEAIHSGRPGLEPGGCPPRPQNKLPDATERSWFTMDTEEARECIP